MRAVALVLVTALGLSLSPAATGLAVLGPLNSSAALCDQGVSASEAGTVCSELFVDEFSKGNLLYAFREADAAGGECTGDYVFPLFAAEPLWSTPVRVVMYFLLMVWCFLGVAIISDHFMAAIEVITSKEKVLVLQNEDGESQETRVLVWNETVANLTLMALGSSAPEILLSVVETIGQLDSPTALDGLGPATIVGSAAFNLLCITATCMLALEEGDKRHIKDYGVFCVTATFSVFAYVWMFLVLQGDGEVTLVEALFTLALFPLLVGTSYAQSKKWWGVFGSAMGQKVAPEAHVVAMSGENHTKLRDRRKFSTENAPPVKTVEDQQKERIATFLSDMPRGLSDDDVAKSVAADIMQKKTTAMRYRINARRQLAGGRSVIKRRIETVRRVTSTVRRISSLALPQTADSKSAIVPSILKQGDASGSGSGSGGYGGESGESGESGKSGKSGKSGELGDGSSEKKSLVPKNFFPVVSFPSYAFSVRENSGFIELPVVRMGSPTELALTSTVYFETRSVTARGGEDFKHAEGKLIFAPGEEQKKIRVDIIDDNVCEPDETFQVVLSVRRDDHNTDLDEGDYSTAEVTIIDDDHAGNFSFPKGAEVVRESDGKVVLVVKRQNGISGRQLVQFATTDASAKDGRDYLAAKGTLVFDEGVTERTFEVAIIDRKRYDSDMTFGAEFTIVKQDDSDSDALYGDHKVVSITVTSDERFHSTVDRIASLMRIHLDQVEVGTVSWQEQLREALTVQGEDGEDPAMFDNVMHILTFGWKVLFTLVPPTSYYGGKLSFCVSLLFIGVLTAVVGDIARVFGCLLGIPNSLTAITLVALGTSLPDTFASKTAAENDETADNSIGNITGSNSVNVFLGLGLPWIIAVLYKKSQGQKYYVATDNLSFTVVVFCSVAFVFFVIMYVRRKLGFGELGGPTRPKWATFFALLFLWAVYITLSAMQSLGHISV